MLKISSILVSKRTLPLNTLFSLKHKYLISDEQKKNLTEPFVVQKKPKRLELQVSKQYWYCACGLSNNQPFCDGSHNGTKFTPIKFTADKDKISICQCRKSKNQPFCDGAHKTIDVPK